MEEDIVVNAYFSDNARFADLINGLVFGGRQVVKEEELEERDSQTGIWQIWDQAGGGKKRYRDLLRRAPFGVSFAIMGLENQKEVHYLMPVRAMEYDSGEYRKQAAFIEKSREKQPSDSGEFMSRLGKDDILQPCITLVLYYGKDWDGSKTLYDLLELEHLPEELRSMVNDYHINLFEIHKIENTDIFRTDIKLVFDVIRCSEDDEKLEALIKGTPDYGHLKEDAYMLIEKYIGIKKFISARKKYKNGDEVDMCKALIDMQARYRNMGRKEGRKEGRQEGRKEGRKEGRQEGRETEKLSTIRKLKEKGMDEVQIINLLDCTKAEYRKATMK